MIGTEELVMIFAVVFLLFGANKLPELARSMGTSMGEFKKAQKESELNLRNFEASLKDTESTATKSKIKETAEKLGIETKSKNDDQLLDETQKSNEK